jgi:hypothetical protein
MEYLALKTMIWVGVGIGLGSFVIGALFGSWVTLLRWRVQDGRDKRMMREIERRVKSNHVAVWRPRLKGMRQIWK